jgi:hypothetical protein
VNGRPGFDERSLRIDDESVEIENQCANHRTYKSEEGAPSQAAVQQTPGLRGMC